MGPQHTSIRKARALLGTTPFLGNVRQWRMPLKKAFETIGES
jgi:hypothetical protein